MLYCIIPNHFAPKRRSSGFEKSSHAIGYGACNFDCVFCAFKLRPKNLCVKYDDKGFKAEIDKLFLRGANFKFTGGEPTLNPNIIEHLTYVKNKGGFVYLDSNGSNPVIIKKLLDLGLVDVLGLSIKGVTREEAALVSQRDPVLAWDNVLETLNIAGNYERVHILVTLVFTKENYKGRIVEFANIIKHIPNVQLKINNLLKSIPEHNLISIPQKTLEREIKLFIAENLDWIDRIVLIKSKKAVRKYEKIGFF